MLNRQLFFCLLLIAVVVSAAARAFVVQETSDAMSFNNYYRDADFENKKEELLKDKDLMDIKKESLTESYKAFADKIFSEPLKKEEAEKFFVLNLADTNVKNLLTPSGYTIYFVLPEDSASTWRADCSNENIFRPISSQSKDGMRILEFYTLKRGVTKVYIDKISSNNQSSQSVIVTVKVSNEHEN